MAEMIVLKGLIKRFGDLLAVDDISLDVKRGEVLGFLGPNGAGKSTTMKMIAGFLTPTAGTATVCGHEVTEQPVEVKKRIGYLPEGAPTYGDMTPATFLDFIAEIRGFTGTERTKRVDAVVETVDIKEVLCQRIETLSKGFKRRVGLAQSMLHDPEVLILDEPTDGLDPNQKHHVRNLIRDMAANKAIIISTHILEEVEAVCSRAVVIGHGRLLADGTAEDLMARLPYHNAVAVRVTQDNLSIVQEGLSALGPVEAVAEAGGLTRLRVAADDGKARLADVAGLIQDKGLAVREVFVERGRMDDAFRDITKGETMESLHQGDGNA